MPSCLRSWQLHGIFMAVSTKLVFMALSPNFFMVVSAYLSSIIWQPLQVEIVTKGAVNASLLLKI